MFVFCRNQFFGVLVLYTNLMLVGVNNIVFYSSLLFNEAGLDHNKAAYATVGVFALQFIVAGIGVSAEHSQIGVNNKPKL